MQEIEPEELYSLSGVSDDGTTLEMLHGSRWDISPGDITTVCTWIPTTAIGVTCAAPDSLYPYKLQVIGTDIFVMAMREC